MDVIEVTDNEFNDLLNTNQKVVIKFVADWCGSCKLFAPKFKRIASNESFSDTKFVEINAEENTESRKIAGVNNLPFIALFKNGTLVNGRAISLEDKAIEFIQTNLYENS